MANSLLHTIHDVFPADDNDENDPTSLKKQLQGDGQWALVKEILGWVFDGEKKTMQLEAKKAETLLKDLKAMGRSRRPIPFKEFEKTLGRARHAAEGIPAGKGMFTPINMMLGQREKVAKVWIRPGSPLQQAINDLRTLIKEAQKEPTHCKELVTGHPGYVGIVDAAKEGAGGVIIGENSECVPTVSG